LEYKYKQENIPKAIARVILENKTGRIHHSKIRRGVKRILRHELSDRQLLKNLSTMVQKKLLDRDDPTGKRGSRVQYSLTETGERTYHLKILGTDKAVEKRKNLYQILLSFQEFKKTHQRTERQLGRFLRQIGYSRTDLKEIRTSNGGFPRSTIYEPIRGVKIVKWIQSDSKVDPKNIACYYIAIPGFTVKEFISYLKKLRIQKEPRPFSSYQGITDVPFVLYRNYTNKAVENAIDSLRKDGLIKIINAVFPGEMRFDIADESLRQFVKDVWDVHLLDFRLLNERLAYDGKPTEEIKNYLALLYGQDNVDKILIHSYPTRISYKNEIKNDKQKRAIAKRFIRDFDNRRRSRIKDIINTHKKVIKEHKIATELIEEISFQPFNSQSVRHQ